MRWKKEIDVNGKAYEVVIIDSIHGFRGLFLVKIYEGRKRWFSPYLMEFTTYDDPMEIAEREIRVYQEACDYHERIFNNLNAKYGEESHHERDI